MDFDLTESLGALDMMSVPGVTLTSSIGFIGDYYSVAGTIILAGATATFYGDWFYQVEPDGLYNKKVTAKIWIIPTTIGITIK
jgi:hypothetical protein